MWLKKFFKGLYYSFPVQLVVMHLKKNQLLLLYWIIMMGFVFRLIGDKYGISLLFLDPEYLGEVDQWAFFVMGIAIGTFTMAFHISSYILNSFRFPFLATISKTFLKFSINNFILPVAFICIYIFEFASFQYYEQFVPADEVFLFVLFFLIGMWIIMLLIFRYFIHINKDLSSLFGVELSEAKDTPHKASRVRKKPKSSSRRTWKVETYLSFPFKIRLVRSTKHYKNYMLQSVFKQNHINAAVLQITIIALFIALGLFRDVEIFKLPAAASLIILFTIIIMISGVLRYWLRGWANTVIIVLLIALNFVSQFELFHQKNAAYGLDYSSKITYNLANMERKADEETKSEDIRQTMRVLNKWKAKLEDRGINKPKLVVLNASGGGLRSMVFTFSTLQAIDNKLSGELMNYTQFISGSSGGLISTSYYRQLFHQHQEKLKASGRNISNEYLVNVGKDLLNAPMLSATVGDLFVNVQYFNDGKYVYVKDRAYAFENQLNENTDHVMDVRLEDLRELEQNAEIPMQVICPTIINDGRGLVISPMGVSYLVRSRGTKPSDLDVAVNNVEFTRYFEDQDAMNLKLTSALRMNCTFPYIMPVVTLPTEPTMEVMDAGIRDNYGVLNTVQYLYTFKDWIEENTSGVVYIRVRDNYKRFEVEDNSVASMFRKISAPFRNLSGNFLVMQDYNHDAMLDYTKQEFDCDFDIVTFEMPYMPTKIALNWHLTNRDKDFIKYQVYNAENMASMRQLKRLLQNQIAEDARLTKRSVAAQAYSGIDQ